MEPLQSGDPRQVGSYRLEGRLGAGGMGQVFLGSSPGGRQVAVKLIRPEHAGDPQFRARFAREVEAARQVGGFHTAQVVDADPDAGSPWLVTEFIAGPSLQQVIGERGRLAPDAVRALGAGLAEGLTAIHGCGLVHRDLKPGNVIMAGDGPRIIDFGIARAADATSMTSEGAVIGTFAFMAPEQVRAEQTGPACDVFSLGCVLAYAATGRSPFDAATIPAIVHRVLNDEPGLGDLSGDLRELIEACLAKSPADRPTAAEFLTYLATPGSAAKAIAGTRRRTAPAVGVGGADETRLHATMPVTRSLSADAQQEPAHASGRIPRRALVLGALAAAATAAVPMVVLLRQPGDHTPSARAATPRRNVPNAAMAPSATLTGHTGSVSSVAFSPDGRILASGSAMDKAIRLWDVATGRNIRNLSGHPGDVLSVAFSPDGKTLASGHLDATARLWDVATGRRIRTFDGDTFSVNSVAFSPDGKILAGANPEVRLWEVASGRTIVTLTGSGKNGVDSVAFSPDGKTVAAALDGSKAPGGTVLVWNVATGRRVAMLTGHTGSVNSAMFGPDGKTLASGGVDKTVRLWDMATRRTITTFTGSTGNVSAVAFSPDGRTIAGGGADKAIRLWDVATGRITATLTGHTENIESVAFSPDGTAVACGGGFISDKTVQIWKVR